MAQLFSTATEYIANELTILRGSVSDIEKVGVYHDADPDVVPDPGTPPSLGDFTEVTLVDGTVAEPPPLAEDGKIDVLSLVGPRGGQVTGLTPGDYQRWVLIRTATEDIIRRPDTLEIA